MFAMPSYDVVLHHIALKTDGPQTEHTAKQVHTEFFAYWHASPKK